MGKKKSHNNSYKTKANRNEEKIKRRKKIKKSVRCQKRADKREKQKTERGLSDICSNLVKLGIDQGKLKNFVNSDRDQKQPKEFDKSSANEDLLLNSTSRFLLDNGLNLSEMTLRSKNKNRKKGSKKKTQKSFSMVKLLSSLPEVDEESEDTTETSLPVTITKPSSFQFNQRDAKKFYKKIIRKERTSSRKLKIKLD